MSINVLRYQYIPFYPLSIVWFHRSVELLAVSSTVDFRDNIDSVEVLA